MTSTQNRDWPWWTQAIVCSIILGFTFWWIGLAVRGALHSARLKQTHNNLKSIGRALHQYHEEFSRFPPPVVYDGSGDRMHSWRSLIQPYIFARFPGDRELIDYRYTEPWDSPHNLGAARSHPFDRYDYMFLAILGPGAAWNDNEYRRIRDFADGTSNTLLVVGLKETGIRWHEPRDLTFDGEQLWLESGGQRRLIDLSKTKPFALFADGTVEYWGEGIRPAIAKALITRAGGEDIDRWNSSPPEPQQNNDEENIR